MHENNNLIFHFLKLLATQSCSALSIKDIGTSFDRSVHRYSYAFQEWDPIYKFGKMKRSRILHRLGNSLM